VHKFWRRRSHSNGGNGDNGAGILDPDAKPDFLCVGAQKGGTTWLCQQLHLHADFWMPPLKEVNYFDHMSRSRHPARAARSNVRVRDGRDRRFLDAMENLCAQQHIDLDRYAQLFAPKGDLLSGDISPAYSIVPEEIIMGIARRFPNLKIIFLARDPVERAWSDLSMAVHYGGIRPFDCTNSDEVMCTLLHPDLVMRSFQTKTVERWQRYISPAQFRVYFFDDLQNDPAQTRREIVGFLGGEPEKFSGRVKAERKINSSEKKLALTDRVRTAIAHFFEQELKACAEKLGGAARKWPRRYGFVSILGWLLQIGCDSDFFLWDFLDFC
jgi:hypothetical protein